MQTVEPQPAHPSYAVAASLADVAKLYGTFAALRKISVDFPVGSSTVILGDNGAGKSTLLRILAGLISPSRGTVSVFFGEPQEQRHLVAKLTNPGLHEAFSGIVRRIGDDVVNDPRA